MIASSFPDHASHAIFIQKSGHTSICGGLNINIGTLNERTIKGMFTAGKKANELGHPILLDPVGAGASALRTDTSIRQ